MSQDRLSKLDAAWVKSTEAWLKTQATSIRSCEVNIRHHQEQIELLKQSIAFERKELNAKKRAYRISAQGLKEFKQQRSKTVPE